MMKIQFMQIRTHLIAPKDREIFRQGIDKVFDLKTEVLGEFELNLGYFPLHFQKLWLNCLEFLHKFD